MVEALTKDELKELKELSGRVTSPQYVCMLIKVLDELRDARVHGNRLYTGTDMLMMAGRSLLKELRRYGTE